MTTRSEKTRLALISIILIASSAFSGCTPRVNVGLPPGLAQNEARRLVSANEKGARAYRNSDEDEAVEQYKEAVSEYREFPAAWNNLGVLMMSQDEYLQAAEAFFTAADLAPSDPRPVYNLGLLYDRRGYIREARQHYERSLGRDASYLPALRGAIRADSLLNEGSLQTLQWLERALMLEQDDRWEKWMRLQKARIENLPQVKVQSQF